MEVQVAKIGEFELLVGLLLIALVGHPQLQDKTIHAAAADGDLARVQAILSQNPELVEIPDERGFTPLHLAVRGGHGNVVDALLSRGADINARHPQYGLAAVDFAFEREVRGGIGTERSADLTRYLVSHGAEFDPSATMRGFTRLLRTTLSGNSALAELLIELGADVDAEREGSTALTFAARTGKPVIARLLLANGAAVDPRDADGKTPLLWAVERAAAEVVEALLANGADIGIVDEQTGRSLLHLAAFSGSVDVVSVLLSHGLAVDATDGNGKTPLYYAARYGHQSVANQLVAHGAAESADMEERYGVSPHLTRRMDRGEAAAWYLANRGWVIRTHNHILVFDAEEWGVTRPPEPSLSNGFITDSQIRHLDVVAMYTTYHGEIGEPGTYIHEIEGSLPNVTYVHNEREPWRWPGNTVYLSPGGQTAIGDVQVATIEVTQTMTSLGYLVSVDGLTIYYAGFRAESLDDYRQKLEALAERTDRIDMAFLPMAEPDEEESAFKTFVERFNPRAVFVLDPNRREHLYPEMARKVRAWGFDSTVYSAEHPGDVFVYRR
jgi:ankyrin repeat protein